MKRLIDEFLIKKSTDKNFPYIQKWISARKKDIVKFDGDVEVLVLEPIISDFLEFQNGEMDIVDFVESNTSLEKKEIEKLPFNVFVSLKDKIIDFTLAKDEEQEGKDENLKKN